MARFDEVLSSAEVNAGRFADLVVASENIEREIHENGWDVPGVISPDMLHGVLLDIVPGQAETPERQAEALQRLGQSLIAFGALTAFLDTPLNLQDPTSTPRRYIWRMRR